MVVAPAAGPHARTPGIIPIARELKTLLSLLRSAAKRLRHS
jgi:hypothetical protein